MASISDGSQVVEEEEEKQVEEDEGNQVMDVSVHSGEDCSGDREVGSGGDSVVRSKSRIEVAESGEDIGGSREGCALESVFEPSKKSCSGEELIRGGGLGVSVPKRVEANTSRRIEGEDKEEKVEKFCVCCVFYVIVAVLKYGFGWGSHFSRAFALSH